MAQRDILQEAFDQIEAEIRRELAVEDARFDAMLAKWEADADIEADGFYDNFNAYLLADAVAELDAVAKVEIERAEAEESAVRAGQACLPAPATAGKSGQPPRQGCTMETPKSLFRVITG